MINHIAFIMDGNGRWAAERGLPRSAGHKEGVKTLKNVIKLCCQRGIGVISVYAFSTENWSRPKPEVGLLFKMVSTYLNKELSTLMKEGIRVRVMGDYTALPPVAADALKNAVDKSANCRKHVLNIGINYGSRNEIVRAVNRLIEEGKAVTEADLAGALDTSGLPDPDLIVRTGGEQRLSNFMLYQAAYSELYFTKCYWPDFDEKELCDALDSYNRRSRRYGGI